MRKTPGVAFCMHKIQTTKKTELYELIDDIPMKIKDYAFLADIIEGLDNTTLAKKYHKTASGISQWKRRIFDKIHLYEVKQIEARNGIIERR